MYNEQNYCNKYTTQTISNLANILTKLLKCTFGKSKDCLVEQSKCSKCCQPYHYHQFSEGTSQRRVVLHIPVWKVKTLN